MDLFSATFTGYRRFADTWINLDAPVIAIVGPNEAGKTSLLRALARAADDEPIADTDVTRGLSITPDAVLVQLRFRITPAEVVEPYPEGAARWFIVSKPRNGPRTFEVQPPLQRDLSQRRRLVAALKTLSERRWFEGVVAGTPREDIVASAVTLIDVEDQSLPDETVENLRALRVFLLDELAADSQRRDVQRVAAAIDDALVIESDPHPNDVAIGQLRVEVPTFLEFDEPNRSLRSTYNLQDPNDLNSPALQNLAKTASLNLRALRDAIAGGNTALAKTLLGEANEHLRSVLTEAWHQSELEVELDHEASVLQVFARTNRKDFFFIEDRSDGLRSFIALHAFAHQSGGTRPILLVDEAEVHLHYDAQADMVGVFEAQELADRIVYTTHSAGCLPRDLGRSVRVVHADPTADRSEIKNQFWELGPGATPLILSMGATTLAFAAARYAVFAEGASDHLLLPTLMREVTNLETLPFQVLPGLAGTRPARFQELQLDASRTAFVVDGDDAGEALRKALVGAGIPQAHVVMLGKRMSSGLLLEDLVDPTLLCAALNEEIRRWAAEVTAEIRPTDLPRRMRTTAIRKWCEAKGLTPPGHAAVAVRVLTLLQRDDSFPRIADAGRVGQIRDLFVDCVAALGIPR